MEDLKILYEDNHIIVVVKKPGIPTQGDKTGDKDMLTIVKEYIKVKYNKPGNVYLGLVHRLDRMVGGVMVFAKTSKAASRISEYIRQKNVKKRYLAVVNGTLPVSDQKVELRNYLVKNERLNMSRVVDSTTKGSKEAILEYKVLKNFTYNGKDYSLVDIDLHTGRHHQIRLQFANIGHPLYGDVKYGQKVNKVGQNLALFSYYLSFFHPTKDEYLEFEFKPNELEKRDKIWDVIK
ncbi:MAG: RNA pseudouridine synthase [Clostridia bacterium]|nr:RNA pseudouridine synthase [Clostridia bacterium]